MTRKLSSRVSLTGCGSKDKDNDNDDHCAFGCIKNAGDVLQCIIPSWQNTIRDMQNLDQFGEEDNFSNIKRALYKNDRIYYIIATLCIVLLILFLLGMMMKKQEPPAYSPMGYGYAPPPPPWASSYG